MIFKKNLTKIILAVFLFFTAIFPARAAVVFDKISTYATVKDLVEAISNWFLSIVAGVAILFLIVGGIYYLTAYGDENRMQEGKKIITYTIYGLIIILISYSVVTTLNAIIFG